MSITKKYPIELTNPVGVVYHGGERRVSALGPLRETETVLSHKRLYDTCLFGTTRRGTRIRDGGATSIAPRDFLSIGPVAKAKRPRLVETYEGSAKIT